MPNFALLVLRLTVGTLMAGHGAQKLFGWFQGPGLKGTSGFMEKLGMSPGGFWGPVAALGEFLGGTLTALGLFHPVGPQNIAAAMTVATRRAHWGKPIWASAGGAELPATNFAAAATLMLAGQGKYSLDQLFGIRLPRWFVALTYVHTALFLAAAIFRPEAAQPVMDRFTGNKDAYTGPADSESHPHTDDVVIERRPVAETADEKERAEI